MKDPNWKTLDVPDVPDPSATQPPSRVDPDLLDRVPAAARTLEAPERPLPPRVPQRRPSRAPLVGAALFGIVGLAVLAAALLGLVAALLVM